MVDQLVAAAGGTFIGTYLSTFSAFVMRARGYRSDLATEQHNLAAAEAGEPLAPHDGAVKNSLYFDESMRELMGEFFVGGGWMNEYAAGWRDLDEHEYHAGGDRARGDLALRSESGGT